MRDRKWRLLVLFAALTIIAIIGLAKIMYNNSTSKDIPLVYAKNQMLRELWNDYKNSNIEPGSHRTLDKQQNFISTSEGQSYTMLRAVWMDDQKTFDESLQWTKDNLQRPDHLLSWKFGQLPNGKYGVQTHLGGQNTAADGDTDIALSLLMAYSRWQQDSYLYDAKPLISAIWEKEVVLINGKPVLVANDLERKNPDKVIVNPSYLAPYAYKVFAHVDKSHNWTGLVDNSYELIAAASNTKLDTTFSVGLPPDWVTIKRSTGEITAPQSGDLTTKFSYDAIRIPWRLALDWEWYKDPRDKAVLSNFGFLKEKWIKNSKILASYKHDGIPAADYEAPAAYGATIGYFAVLDPAMAHEIYSKKISTLYSPDEQKLAKPLGYYDDNWSWFGAALVLKNLPNLTAAQKK